ncbi:MAG TPA: RHS repeat-associated core domain-containing protein, partial [Iamia sp.]|nr:RHS repeat-associated core domain-containing protein [Iamia sp.]
SVDGRARAWSHDAAGQVTGRTDSAGPDHAYTYGPRGLRFSATVDGVTTTSTYDDGARLVDSTDPTGTTTYGYDADGRRVDVTPPGAGTPLHTTYDSRGLPVEIDLTATDTQQRGYDVDGRLVEIAQTGAPTQTQAWNPAEPTWQPVVVRDPSGYQHVEHAMDGVVSERDDGGTVTPYRQDRQGSTTTSVPVPGAPAVYEPFGQGGSPSAIAGYRGERLLAGLIHLRHRDYDPTTGTFTTRDPLDGIAGTPTETNPYHYADNDPANKTDPLGLSPSDDDVDCDTANANDPAYQVIYGSHEGYSCDDMWRPLLADAIGCFGDAISFGIVSEAVGDRFSKDNMFCAGGTFYGIGAGFALGGGSGAGDDVGRWADDAANVGDDLARPGAGLYDELTAAGIKFNPEKVVRIGRDGSGRIVWLEQGSSASGLRHILERHGDEFLGIGIAREDVASFVFNAATRGRLVGFQGAGEGRGIYEVVWNGQLRRVAVTIGDNGYIVGANPR